MPGVRPSRPGPGPGRFFRSRGSLAEDGAAIFVILDYVSPASASSVGGGTITIYGSNFRLGPAGQRPSVTIGGAAATGVVLVDDHTLTATIPAGAVGAADVTVTDFYGTTDTLDNAFTYWEPAIIALEPNNGPVSGGTVVRITGVNFSPGATILFGTQAATGVTYVDAQHYIAISPVPTVTGPVTVSVNNAQLPGGFFYVLRTPDQALRRNPSVQVSHAANAPATCEYTIDGRSVPPKAGSLVELTDQDSNVVFSGVAQIVTQKFEELTHQLIWEVNATDYTVRLNKRRPRETYVQQSVTTIIYDLCSKYAPWVDVHYVQTNLPKVDVVFDGTQEFSDCLTTLMRLMGRGQWRLDKKELHAFRVPPTQTAGSTRHVSSMATGPGTAPVATQSSQTKEGFAYPAGYYLFASSFIFSNNTESVPGPWSNVVALDGSHLPQLTSIAIGSGAGSYSVVGRRIYYKFFGIGGAVDVGFFDDVADNSTTTLVSSGFELTGSRGVPRLPYVAPPVGSSVAPQLFQSEQTAKVTMGLLVPGVAGLVSYSFQPGYYVVSITNVYANGTESQEGPISNLVLLDGQHAVTVAAPAGQTIDGVAVVFRKVYGSHSGSTTQYTDIGATAFWGIVPDNTSSLFTLAPGLKQLGSQVPPTAGDPLVDPSHEDGPNPEDADNPDEINDANQSQWLLLDEHPLTSSEDVTQAKNRVIVIGRGVETAPPVVMPPPSANPTIGGTPTLGTVDPYAGSVAMYSDGTMPSEYIANHPTLLPWRGGYPMSARWAQIQRDQIATAATASNASTSGASGSPAGWPGQTGGRAFYGYAGMSVGGGEAGTGNPYSSGIPDSSLRYAQPVPSTPTGTLATISTSPNDGVDRFRDYLGSVGITPAYLETHPYTALMDLPENYYEAGGAAGVTPLTGNVPTMGDFTENAGQPITPVVTRPMYAVDDLESQRYFGSIELDDDGNPTDGIHEIYLDGSHLPSAEACIAYANAYLSAHAWPAVTVTYATRNPKAKLGRVQTFNLSKPPLKGSFAIQNVQIDQIRNEVDQLSPRYFVTATSIYFDLNDLLSLIGTTTPVPPQSVGANPMTIVQATEQARVETATVVAKAKQDIASTLEVQTHTVTLTEDQCRNLNGSPVVLVPGMPGKLIVPICSLKRVTVTSPFTTSVNGSTRYTGTTISLGTISLFANGTARYDSNQFHNVGFSNINQDLRGLSFEIYNTGSNPSGGLFTAPMTITTLFVAVDWYA